ncbi:MAG: hypothetical protein QXQ64_00990 [Candidatus Bathyarchaeia archaeon]
MFFEGDKLSESIAKYISRTTRTNVSPHSSIDYTRPFIFINSSNRHHNRTFEFVKLLSHINGYVHIDNHDDIALLPGASRTGPANFVESILALGKIVKRYGQSNIQFLNRCGERGTNQNPKYVDRLLALF